MKPTLPNGIAQEQFGFLHQRHIQDVVSIAQETVHIIKYNNLKAIIMKLNLQKDFDCVYWTFIQLVLHKIGISFQVSKFIMACVSTANFSILINKLPTELFSASQGLQQGCALLPLLFIIVIEGLSIFLLQAHMDVIRI